MQRNPVVLSTTQNDRVSFAHSAYAPPRRAGERLVRQEQLIDGFHWLNIPLGFVFQTHTCLS